MVHFSNADTLHTILSRGNTTTLSATLGDLTADNLTSLGDTTTVSFNGEINGGVRNIVAGTGLIASNLRRNVWLQGSGGAVTVTATPSVSGGQNGEIMTLIGNSDVNTLTLQDESNLANSDLMLAGNTDVVLGEYDTITLVFSQTKAKWIETSRSNN